jgi:uncharacterized damage-inducible protein DinB
MNPEQATMLFEYNAWANHRIFLKVAHLSAGELVAPAPLSHGSILGDLVHMIDTQWYWREGSQTGNLPVKSLSASDFEDLAALRLRWEQEDQLLLEYVRNLSPVKLEGDVTYKWPQARPRTRPLWQILMHIYTHGTHHRSEIGRHLATLGQSPGDMDFLKFTLRKRTHDQSCAV